MADEEEQEFVLVVVVKATDIKDAIDKLASGRVLSVGPPPQVQSGVFGQAKISPGGQTITRNA